MSYERIRGVTRRRAIKASPSFRRPAMFFWRGGEIPPRRFYARIVRRSLATLEMTYPAASAAADASIAVFFDVPGFYGLDHDEVGYNDHGERRKKFRGRADKTHIFSKWRKWQSQAQ